MQRSDWYSDTDPRALEVFLECQRRMTASEKVHGILQLNRRMNDLSHAFRLVVEALDRSTIPFTIGGSMASGIYGVFRTSLDVDLVADMRPGQIPQLILELGGAFYADADMIRDALGAGRSFLIHLASSYKFDVFPLIRDSFDEMQFSRRVVRDIVLEGDTLSVPAATAEDTLLMKLAWYRAGGEVSERQWNDVRGIIAVQQDCLDREYLNRWAVYLKVEDLLDEVLSL